MTYKRVKPSTSIIPDGDPDPELQAQVREALGIREPRKVPTMADALPEGISEAPVPDPTPEIMLPPPTHFHKPQADELAPAFTPIRRVTDGELAQMPWVLKKLQEHYPHIGPASWMARLHTIMRENGYLFVRNDHAIALAYMTSDLFETQSYVAPVFVVYDPDEKDKGTVDAVRLVREIVRWGRTLGATEVRNLQRHCEVTPSRANAEKREEVFIRIK